MVLKTEWILIDEDQHEEGFEEGDDQLSLEPGKQNKNDELITRREK